MTDRFLNLSKSFTITYLRAMIGRIGMTSIFHLDIKRVDEVSVKDFEIERDLWPNLGGEDHIDNHL